LSFQKKKPNQKPAGAALPLQLLKPAQFIPHRSAKAAAPVTNGSGNQGCLQTAAAELMAPHFLICKGC